MRLLFVVVDFNKSTKYCFWFHETTNDFWFSTKPLSVIASKEDCKESDKIRIEREEVQAQIFFNKAMISDKQFDSLKEFFFYIGNAIRVIPHVGLKYHERFGLIRSPYWELSIKTNQKTVFYTYKMTGESQLQLKKYINVMAGKFLKKAAEYESNKYSNTVQNSRG